MGLYQLREPHASLPIGFSPMIQYGTILRQYVLSAQGPIKHENEYMAVMDAVQLLNAKSDFESWMGDGEWLVPVSRH